MERIELMKTILGAEDEDVSSSGCSSGMEEEEDDSGDSQILSDALSSSSVGDDEDADDDEEQTYYVFKEENPYKMAEADDENRIYQIIGNDLILLTRAEGVCCMCSSVQQVLYADNSNCGNIPIQVCVGCVKKIVE